MSHSLIFPFITLIVVIINFVWYGAKFFIRSKGYPASLFYNHGADFTNLKKIAATATIESDRKEAKYWLFGLHTAIALLVVFAVIMLFVAITEHVTK